MADDPLPTSKLTRSKERWACEGRFLTGKTARPGAQRLPPATVYRENVTPHPALRADLSLRER
jgi:hypothetical protein